MSQSSGLGAAYAEARCRAKQALAHGVSEMETCANEANLLLVLFLQEARDLMQAQGSENMAKAYGRAAKMVRQHPLRLHSRERLLQVHGFGPATSSAVEKHLWSDAECRPAPPGSEEQEVEQHFFESVHSQQLSQRAAAKQQQAEERAAFKRRAAQLGPASAPAATTARRGRGAAARGGTAAAAAAAAASAPAAPAAAAAAPGDPLAELAAEAGADAGGGGQKKRRTKAAAKRPYVPGVGTANYAFMVALYEAQQSGQPFLTKHDLIDRAEALHITNKPIKGNRNAPIAPGAFVYDGWSCFNSLANGEPPLAQVYSNPKKCRLTPEGAALAQRLYLDAVERGSIIGQPAILASIRSAAPAAEGPSGSGGLAALAPPTAECGAAAGAAWQQPGGLWQGAAAPCGQLGGSAAAADQLAGARGRAGLSSPEPHQQQQRQAAAAGASGAAGGGRDADIASLLEMGFTPQQARKGLAGGRTVQAAVEVIALDSDSDSEPVVVAQLPAAAAASQTAPTAGSSGLPAAQLAGQLSLAAGSSRAGQSQSLRAAAGLLAASTRPPPAPPASFPVARGTAAAPAAAAPAAGALGPLLPAQPAAQLRADASGAAPGPRSPGLSRPAAPASLDSLIGSNRQHHSQTRLQAAWRLPPLAAAAGGSAAETELRLPPLLPGQRFSDRYEVCLVLDQREQFGGHMRSAGGGVAQRGAEAVAQLTAMGVTVLNRTLEAGDVLWAARERGNPGSLYALDAILERKRIDDLAASIRDQRYERQKYFLARCGMRRTLYLLEGDVDLSLQGPIAKACKTAAHRLEVEDGFRVLRTRDSAQTLRLYRTLTAELQATYAPLRPDTPEVARGGEPLPTLEQLNARLRLAKKVTLRDVWGLMLCTVPRISAENCETILREFPTPLALWRAYDGTIRAAAAEGRHTVAAANALLTRLHRIGPDTSRAVFASLFANGWQAAPQEGG